MDNENWSEEDMLNNELDDKEAEAARIRTEGGLGDWKWEYFDQRQMVSRDYPGKHLYDMLEVCLDNKRIAIRDYHIGGHHDGFEFFPVVAIVQGVTYGGTWIVSDHEKLQAREPRLYYVGNQSIEAIRLSVESEVAGGERLLPNLDDSLLCLINSWKCIRHGLEIICGMTNFDKHRTTEYQRMLELLRRRLEKFGFTEEDFE